MILLQDTIPVRSWDVDCKNKILCDAIMAISAYENTLGEALSRRCPHISTPVYYEICAYKDVYYI